MPKIYAKCIAHAFDSKNAIQYFPGDLVELDLANTDQRKLVWLRTPRGKWIFQFDRANNSDPSVHIYFCKKCGMPFEKLNEIGTHDNEYHNKAKVAAELAQADQAAEDEQDDALLELVMAQPMPVDKAVDDAKVAEQQKAKLRVALEQQRAKYAKQAQAQ